MKNVATVCEHCCYSDNCLPETREKKKRKRKRKRKRKTLKSETQTRESKHVLKEERLFSNGDHRLFHAQIS